MSQNIKKIAEKILENPLEYAQKITTNKLVNILKQLSHYYYNTGEELVTDDIYDLLREILEKRDSNNPYLSTVGAPICKDMVKLPYFMPSLDKIKADTNALDSYIKKYSGPYVVSDKLDGVSGLYINSHQIENCRLYTRGDGSNGQNISHLLTHILFDKINHKLIPNGVAIRGELIMSKNNFNNFSNQFKNARNAVAGLVNSINFNINVAKNVDFIGYSIIYPENTIINKMNSFNKWKFPSVEYIIKDNITNKFLSDYLVDRRLNGLYEIDGLVVSDSSKIYKSSNNNPSHAFAFKKILTDQKAEALVLNVEWNISKDGYLKPRVKIDQVSLVGVDINYATAFNAKFVVDNKLGPGAKIELVRSGDVIPHILRTISPSASNLPDMPKIPYKWSKSGVDIIVQDIHGHASSNIKTKQITNFFKIMNVKSISEGIVRKFVDHGYDTIIKIVKVDPKSLSNIDGLGTRIIEKIYSNIDNAFKNATLDKIMAASNIFGRGFAIKRIKLIIKQYPDILTEKWNVHDLKQNIMSIDGFDKITAEQFASNFFKFKTFLQKLTKIVDLNHIFKKPIVNSNKQNNLFLNKKIVFTGFRDVALEKFIEDNGGSLTNSVSNNVYLVVFQDNSKKSSKISKAISLNIQLISKEDFIKKYLK